MLEMLLQRVFLVFTIDITWKSPFPAFDLPLKRLDVNRCLHALYCRRLEFHVKDLDLSAFANVGRWLQQCRRVVARVFLVIAWSCLAVQSEWPQEKNHHLSISRNDVVVVGYGTSNDLNPCCSQNFGRSRTYGTESVCPSSAVPLVEDHSRRKPSAMDWFCFFRQVTRGGKQRTTGGNYKSRR